MITHHDLFQENIDKLWKEQGSIITKINNLVILCRQNYVLLKQMLYYYFKDEQCKDDQYFYLTFTYNDQPLCIYRQNELAISLLLDNDGYFTIEIDIYHYPKQGVIHHTIIEDDSNTTCLLDFASNEGEILNIEYIKKEF